VLKVALLLHLASKSRFTHAVVATSLVEGVVKPAATSDKVRACAIFAVAETTPRGDVKTMLLGLNGSQLRHLLPLSLYCRHVSQ
jgi:hypothetical protein